MRQNQQETKRRVVSFAHVCRWYRDLRSGVKVKGSVMKKRQAAAQGNDQWTGASGSEMQDRLDRGYDFPLGNLPELPIDLEGRGPRWKFNDGEGDYLHEEFLAGEADFYVDRIPEESKPGIYVHAEVTFSAGINHSTITAYGKWVGAALAAIQAMGHDVALRITCTVTDLYVQESGFQHETAVQVTRFGEKLLARDYAVLFSPGGYRHLLFVAQCIPGEEPVVPVGTEPSDYGKKLVTPNYGLGHCLFNMDWGVEFDPDQRILHFTCSQTGSGGFPEESMDEMLKEVQETF